MKRTRIAFLLLLTLTMISLGCAESGKQPWISCDVSEGISVYFRRIHPVQSEYDIDVVLGDEPKRFPMNTHTGGDVRIDVFTSKDNNLSCVKIVNGEYQYLLDTSNNTIEHLFAIGDDCYTLSVDDEERNPTLVVGSNGEKEVGGRRATKNSNVPPADQWKKLGYIALKEGKPQFFK